MTETLFTQPIELPVTSRIISPRSRGVEVNKENVLREPHRNPEAIRVLSEVVQVFETDLFLGALSCPETWLSLYNGANFIWVFRSLRVRP